MQNPANRRETSALSHPSAEEWMSFVYEELPRAARRPLAAHLRSCPECQAQLSQWQGTRKRLTQWRVDVETPASAPTWIQPALKWALAAGLVLGIGFGFGRLSTPQVDPSGLRIALEQSLRGSLRAEITRQVQDQLRADLHAAVRGGPELLNTEFRRDLRTGLDEWRGLTLDAASGETRKLLLDLNDSYRAARQQDQKAILTLFDRADQQRRADFLSLRRAVETVALVADNKFQRTETELGNLVSYAQTQFNEDPREDSTSN